MFIQQNKKDYLEKTALTVKNRQEVEEKIDKKEQQIKKLRAQIKKLEIQKFDKISYPSWIEELVVPIAEYFSNEFNMSYEIYGPFGMRSQITVYWKEEKDKSITETRCKSLVLIPLNLNEAQLGYETGMLKNGTPQTSISRDANGFGNEVLPLPETVEEIRVCIEKKSN